MFITYSSYAQVAYVEVGHPVYKFLDRMNVLNIINNYDDFHFPKTRKQVSGYLFSISTNNNSLNQIDKDILKQFLNEFDYDLTKSERQLSSLFSNPEEYNFISEKEKYLYYLVDSSKFDFFTNFILDNNFVWKNDITNSGSSKVNLVRFGGIIRGSFNGNIGFMIKATNGTYFGDKLLAQSIGTLRYNFKFNEDKINEGGVSYFDDTEGYLTAQWPSVGIKIGRDRVNYGYGASKYLFGNNPPQFDYLSLNMNYGIFDFSFLHGKLLGNEQVTIDPDQGEMKDIAEKYISYHRFGFNFSKHFNLGLGEIVVYSGRPIDLSYLNPFNYYKSAEHANRDRDNSMLFFDLKNNSINGLQIYTSLLIDDIDFGRLNTSYFGNQILYTTGVKIIPFPERMPVELKVQYVLVDPYVFTHRINNNNFTTSGYILNDNILPNSSNLFISLFGQLNYRTSLELNLTFSKRGVNELNDQGETSVNYGGDVNTGHRTNDDIYVKYLDGVEESFFAAGLTFVYEPFNNYFIRVNLQKDNFERNGKDISNNFLSNISFSLRF